MNIGTKEVVSMSLGDKIIQSMYIGNRLIWPVDNEYKGLCFTALRPNSLIKLCRANVSPSPPMSSTAYSFDGETWIDFNLDIAESTEFITLEHAGDKVYFRANITSSCEHTGRKYFIMTGCIAASGNVNSLYSALNFLNIKTLEYAYCYDTLFAGCHALITPPELPATTLSEFCYYNMFANCTSLLFPPDLPATVRAGYCYDQMFEGCNSLYINDTITSVSTKIWKVPTNGVNSAKMGISNMTLKCPGSMTAPIAANTLYTYYILDSTQLKVYYGYNTVTNTLYVAGTLTNHTDQYENYITMLKYGDIAEHIIIENMIDLPIYTSMFKNFTALLDVVGLNYIDLNNKTAVSMFEGCTLLTANNIILSSTTIPLAGYKYMFKNCAALISTPLLNTPILSNYACYEMFKGCTNLTTITSFNNTTIGYYSCGYMFEDCINLINVPNVLPATIFLTYSRYGYGYAYMFLHCTSLLVTPLLPAMELKMGTYFSMFKNCSALTTIQSLPALSVPESCYEYMFEGCTSLISSPPLIATTLGNYCYAAMFRGCTALTTAGELYATSIAGNNYGYMFLGCTNLTEISVNFTTWPDYVYGLYNWVEDVAATGNFYCPASLPIQRGVSYMPSGWNIVDIEKARPFGLTADAADTTIELIRVGNPSIANTVYSFDKITWIPFTPSTTEGTNVITLSNIGDTVYFKNTINDNFDTSNYLNFKITGGAHAIGNLLSMYVASNYSTTTTLTYDYCFYKLFADCAALTSFDICLATILSSHCYDSMFENCICLMEAPIFKTATLAPYCYAYTFKNCSALTTIANWSTVELKEGCYKGMFYGCESLTTAPYLLTSRLAVSCYESMFENCISLTTMPTLPATSLAQDCYKRMFYNCSSLGVYDNSSTTYNKTFSVPEYGFLRNTYAQVDMFANCAGVRSSNTLGGLEGNTYIYYTLNNPNPTNPDYFCATCVSIDPDETYAYCYTSRSALKSSLEYSFDRVTWSSFSNQVQVTEPYTKVYFRGTGNECQGESTYPALYFRDGDWVLSGDVTKLLNYNNTITTIPTYAFLYTFLNLTRIVDISDLRFSVTALSLYAYYYMFSGCTNIAHGPAFVLDTVADYSCAYMFNNCSSMLDIYVQFNNSEAPLYCYSYMFAGCSALNFTCALPAATLGNCCYYYMFLNCANLSVAPDLVATTLSLNCYLGMFYGCSSLTSPPTLPDAILALACYYSMFESCTSLLTAPSLPSMTLSPSCYRAMFRGCTALTTAPNLPALTLADYCYTEMFSGCTNLINLPTLAADTVTLYGYADMFSGCSSITAMPVINATNYGMYACLNMFKNCANLTTLRQLSVSTINNFAFYGMFSYCTNLTTAAISLPSTIANFSCGNMFAYSGIINTPTMPATSVPLYGYTRMFEGCTNLTTAPALPASSLGNYAYKEMFKNCTALTTPPALPATSLGTQCYNMMFDGCTSLYVSSYSGGGRVAWYIPTSSYTTNSSTGSYMFRNCLGSRSTDSPKWNSSCIYFSTPNTPVS